MAREIRISIDDDEVFERMKARKRELDLSWEEVLHRGLRRDEGEGVRGHRGERPPRDPSPPDPINSPGAFAEDLKRQIQGQVRDSLHASLEPTWGDSYRDDPLERDVDTLESAEDAVLVFDFLGNDAVETANRVPLRVSLEASAGGLTAEVVAVRQGKGVASMNAFDASVRRRIVEGLATGEVATLEFDSGTETYPAVPTLSWSRDEGGRPTVVDVTIDEVRFDDD